MVIMACFYGCKGVARISCASLLQFPWCNLMILLILIKVLNHLIFIHSDVRHLHPFLGVLYVPRW